MNAWSENAPWGSHRADGERRLAAAALCAAVAVALSGLWICYLLVNLGNPGVSESAQSLRVLVYGLPAVAAGVLVHAHWPGRPVGWVFIAYGMTVILPAAFAAPLWLGHGGDPLRAAVLVFEALANWLKVTLWYSLPLWFPDGRLARRWWWYVAAVAAWVAPQAFSYAAMPERYGVPNPLAGGWWGNVSALIDSDLGVAQNVTHFVFIALGGTVMFRRVRHIGSARTRAALLALLASYVVWGVAQSITYNFGDSLRWPMYWVMMAASVAMSASVGYVVVRTGSWRLGRPERRILAGLLVVALLTTADVAVVAALVSGMTPSRYADALALVAVAFLMGAGLRRTVAWAVGVVDRLYYGDRAHPYQVLHTLAERISHAGSSQDIPATLCATVVETLRLPAASLAVHTRAGARVLARVGSLGDHPHHFDMLHQGAVVGRLSVGLREGEAELDRQDGLILSSLASQAAPAVASLRLQEELRSISAARMRVSVVCGARSSSRMPACSSRTSQSKAALWMSTSRHRGIASRAYCAWYPPCSYSSTHASCASPNCTVRSR
ncbi:hypothetical protein GCM10019017_08470 [Streptomyces showdoensis]